MTWRTAFACLFLAAAFAEVAPAAGRSTLSPGEHWFTATTNHHPADFTVLVFQPRDGQPWLRVLDLDQLGIPHTDGNALRHRAENYVLPADLPDHEVHLDPIMRRAHFVTRVRPHPPENTPADLLLDVRINGVLHDQPVYVRNTGSDLVLPEETLRQLRLDLPDVYGPFIKNDLPVHALAGETFHFDMSRLYLEMTVPEDRFVTTRVAATREAPERATDWSPSAVLGYNLAGGEDDTGERWHNALADLAFSAGRFTCRTRHLAQSEQEDVLRLDSTCLADWPGVPLSAGVGDHYSATGTLHQTVAYGGFWIGTDYSLQPYRNLQPSLVVTGDARLPSTLEIWMDQQLGLRQDVPPGPFVIDNLPAISGSGELRAVLIDAAGQHVLLSTPVYSDPRLLQIGVVDWRVEAGRLRPGGVAGDDVYTERFGAATGRFGVTRWLTGEVHAEHSDGLSMWSTAAAVRLWHFGLLEAGTSRSRRAQDEMTSRADILGYSWRGDFLHVAFRETRRDPGYVSLGYPEPGDAPSRERQTSLGFSLGPARLTLTGVEREYAAAETTTRLGNAALAIRLGQVGQLLLTATRDLVSSNNEPVYGVHLSIPLGKRSHTYYSASGRDRVDSTSAGFNYSPPTGSGTGFRAARQTFGDSERYFAEGVLRGDAAVASASVEGNTDATSWGTRLAGAVLVSGAGVNLARDDGGSFAVIETGPGAGNVTVRRENQDVATTDGDGDAAISGLLPWQSNRLALDVRDLPLSSDIETDALTVSAGRRNVVIADFDLQARRWLLTRLVLPASARGEIPAGSEVLVDGSAAGMTGFDGTIYVALPESGRVVIEARWSAGGCVATVMTPEEYGIHEAGETRCTPQ